MDLSSLKPVQMRKNRSDVLSAPIRLRQQSPFKVKLVPRALTPPLRTSTLPPKLVFHEVQSIVQGVSKFIKTEEDIENFRHRFDGIGAIFSGQEQENDPNIILDPIPIRSKGRPRTKRLENTALEGRNGGSKRRKIVHTSGPSKITDPVESIQSNELHLRRRRCGGCGKEGHYVTTCPVRAK
ncbi:hypothetical protein DL93DRAFT_2075468 [Clavulina sp. PMI_390]|nr:hypothetical protein DL93DRAFT_2075468 [Clavulina sp. PMI_390]